MQELESHHCLIQQFSSEGSPGHHTNIVFLCGRDEDVQGVLTLFGRGKAQVCHVLRVVELKEQLEVEEEDGDRQKEEEEVESGEVSQGECAMDGMKMIVNALRT